MLSPFPSSAAFPRWDTRRRRTCARCLSGTPGSHSNRIAWRIPLVASGQSKNKMPNDVALHLGGAGFDSISTRAQVGVRPNPILDSVRIAGQQLTVGTENLLGDLLE